MQAISQGGEPPRHPASEEQEAFSLEPCAPGVGGKTPGRALPGSDNMVTSRPHSEEQSHSAALQTLPLGADAKVKGEEHREADAVVVAGNDLPPYNERSAAASVSREGGSISGPFQSDLERDEHYLHREELAEEPVPATGSRTGSPPGSVSVPEGSLGEELRGNQSPALAAMVSNDEQAGGSADLLEGEGVCEPQQRESALGTSHCYCSVQGEEPASLAPEIAALGQPSLEEVAVLEGLKGSDFDHEEDERAELSLEASRSRTDTSEEGYGGPKAAGLLTAPEAVAGPEALVSSRRSSELESSHLDAEVAEDPVPAFQHSPGASEQVAHEHGERPAKGSSPI